MKNLRENRSIEYVTYDPKVVNTEPYYRRMAEIANDKCFIAWLMNVKALFYSDIDRSIKNHMENDEKNEAWGRFQAFQIIMEQLATFDANLQLKLDEIQNENQ